MKKLSFTLAEIMIALTIIGIITSILLPVAMQAVPREDVMKFKKGNATLAKVINELVSSGEYYTPGDLGIKPDGSYVRDYQYLCNTFAQIAITKKLNCSKTISPEAYGEHIIQVSGYDMSIENAKKQADITCKKYALSIGKEIITVDNIIFYQTHPNYPFGMSYKEALANCESEENKSFCQNNPTMDICQDAFRLFNSHYFYDENGFDRIYKVFCMDIDGIGKGEDPFGYGIRADGKIFTGKRADEWLEKDIQEKD